AYERASDWSSDVCSSDLHDRRQHQRPDDHDCREGQRYHQRPLAARHREGRCMTEDDFRAYIAAFNARDFAGFSKYYADNVEFNLGDRKRSVGAAGIVEFYTGVFEHIAE